MSFHMNYNTEPRGWIMEEDGFGARSIAKCESIFAQGNGYLNIRCALEESYVGQCRDAFVAGTFNKAMPDEVTELPNLPDVTELVILVNGERFSLDKGRIHSYSRKLDLRTGECVRKVKWESPEGVELDLCFRRFVSLHEEHAAAFQTEITSVSAPMELVIESGISSRSSNTGSQHCLDGEKRMLGRDTLRLSTCTVQSDIPIVVHCVHKFNKETLMELPVIERRRFVKQFRFQIGKGETLRMEKTACYHTGRDMRYELPDWPAGVTDSKPVCADGDALIEKLKGSSYEELLKMSARAWASYWKDTDIEIESSDPVDQLGMRFALYHLNIMIQRRDSRVGIGAKGMTGEGYKCHSFWDTEMFLLPFYLFTHPQAAKTLLKYRYRSLPGAYRKAAENHYEGAMFPWESAWMDDGEVTPLYGAADIVTGTSIPILTGMLEHHITADIAWGVWLYYEGSMDEKFMDKYGCELLVETARFWSDRLGWKEERKRYEICNVIGPDEYKEHVDNNAFTNYLAAFNLRTAAHVIGIMEKKWPGAWKNLSRRFNLEELREDFQNKEKSLYLPEPDKDGIVAQNEQYMGLEKVDLTKYKTQQGVSSIYEDYSQSQMNQIMVSKQADMVMLLRIFPELFDRETRRKNFIFYESRTLHDSSLSHGQHCVVASWLGMDEMALDMYRHAVNIDMGPNPSSSDEGIHSASMGGVWQCAVCGFAGLKWNGRLSLENHLPKCWKKMTFRLCWRGALLRVELTEGIISISHQQGPEISLCVNGREHILSEGGSVREES